VCSGANEDKEVTIMKVTFLGHACFQIEHDGVTILTDPYLTGNPQAAVKPEDVSPHYILVSHAHGDHIGDAVEIAKTAGATIITTAEVARLCDKQGAKVHGMHIGGKHAFDFGYVRITPAFHGAGVEGGHACGFIVDLGGKKVYFAGDTSLFGDMELLGRLEKLSLALLPIGDNYTMGPDDAVLAVEMLKPAVVVPMHYSTWPLIKADPVAWQQAVTSRVRGTEVRVVAPGESIEL
jgi:L-ascorbate metabolism protein UlaG (beta-lactamase superfamily)